MGSKGAPDPVLDFFDLSKPFTRLRAASTETPSVPQSQVSAFWSSNKDRDAAQEVGTSYSFKYRRRQEEEIRRSRHGEARAKEVSYMMDIETESEATDAQENKYLSPEALDAYRSSSKGPLSFLPIHREKDRILQHIEANQVTVITGVTGCGKTTRVPQFLFDNYFSENRYCNILITQPRRIAAQSIAKRICDERGLQLGGLVGYKVGLDRENVSENTRMLFCTTGILLRTLVSRKSTQEFTHVILDEVHERDIDMDFVLLLVKKFIFTNSRGTKLILMSATSDPLPLQKYFSWRMNSSEDLAGHIKVGGSETPFKINEYFACNKELIRTFKCKGIGPSLAKPEARLYSECVTLCRKIIENFDQLEKYSSNARKPPGAVLVFLPGEYEIQVVRDHLMENRSKDVRSIWKLLPLHSRIPSDEKDLIFKDFNKDANNKNVRKIILSTNMAESSITIPDIVYVMDFCLTKNLRAERATNYVALRLEWADKNSLEQRKGRSGRVSEGRVYRLISQEFYDNCLIRSHDPEMLRAPLEKVILGTKLLDQGPPKEILGLALNPPDLSNVYKSVMHLKEVGALLTTVKGKEKREDGDLTTLGEIIAVLPVDVRLGKLIVLGHIFNVLNEAVIIAAGMSHNSIFVDSFNNKVKSYEFKLMWSDGTFSDGIALKLAYEKWQNLLHTGRFKGIGYSRSSENEQNWCRANFLELKALREMHASIRDIQSSLLHHGIRVHPRPNVTSRKTEHQKYMLIRIVMFGAFYPNYFIQSQNSLDSKEVNKTINGKDHRSTIYFTGFPTEQTPYAALYFGQIRNFFNSFLPADENLRLEIDGSKVLVTFHRRNYESLIDKQCSYRLNGTVLQQVLLGLKLRRAEREQLKLFVYPPERAKYEFEKHNEKVSRERREKDEGVPIGVLGHFDVPLVGKSTTTVQVVHINDPNSFFVHFIKTEKFAHFFTELIDSIKSLSLARGRLVTSSAELQMGHLYLAQYTDELGDSSYYRCRVEKFFSDASQVQVFFIDYGNTSNVKVGDLIKVTFEDALRCPSIIQVPCLAVEATLSFVKPNPLRNKHMAWSSSSVKAFVSKLKELPSDVRVQVYSVIEKCGGEPLASLELISEQDQTSINDWIKSSPPNDTPYGDHSNESYLSQESHRIRSQLSSSFTVNNRSVSVSEYVSEKYGNKEFDGVLNFDKRETKFLRGPFHPLESSLHCLHDLGSSKLVSIAPDSVNSVLLKQFPNEDMDLWLVAGSVNLTPSGDKLSLRSTNFMPAIPAFGSLMTMIFGPKVELRCNAERTRLTGALVGLGDRPAEWNAKLGDPDTGRVPYHSDHDMEIEFDTVIDMTDIDYINKIRFSIDYVLNRPVTSDQLSLDDIRNQINPRFTNPVFLGECHDNIEGYLDFLLSRQRRPVEKMSCPLPFHWNFVPQDILIKSNLASLSGFLKFIQKLELKCKSEGELIASELRAVSSYLENGRIPSHAPDIRCPLCPGGETLSDISAIAEHFEGLIHKYRENRFWAKFRDESAEAPSNTLL